MGKNARMIHVVSLLGVLCVTGAEARQSPPPPAVPREALSAILDAFNDYAIVALGEGPHNNQQGHAFRLSLIRDPRFAERVNDIVVESGSARYQLLMDRFIAGEDVPYQALRDSWQNTVVANTVWDKPMYFEFYTAVRDLNRRLPKTRQLRVLLGDPPIDWDTVRNADDIKSYNLQRDAHAAAVIRREVVDKNRRALVIYGDGHLQGRGMPDSKSLVFLLEQAPAARMFVVSNFFGDLERVQPDVATWPVPSLARVRGTTIGAHPYGFFYPLPPAPGWNRLRMEQQFDAVLYLGPPSTMTMNQLPKSLCQDDAYMAMRFKRHRLNATAQNPDPGAGLRLYCSVATPVPQGLLEPRQMAGDRGWRSWPVRRETGTALNEAVPLAACAEVSLTLNCEGEKRRHLATRRVTVFLVSKGDTQ